MKILGIDYGTKRVGLAISDETQTLARELEIVSPSVVVKKIQELIDQESVVAVVVGLPLNMSGEETKKTKEIRSFLEKLKTKVSVPVETFDERLSSVMAGNLPGGNKNVDSLAAQIILQNYLDTKKATAS